MPSLTRPQKACDADWAQVLRKLYQPQKLKLRRLSFPFLKASGDLNALSLFQFYRYDAEVKQRVLNDSFQFSQLVAELELQLGFTIFLSSSSNYQLLPVSTQMAGFEACPGHMT